MVIYINIQKYMKEHYVVDIEQHCGVTETYLSYMLKNIFLKQSQLVNVKRYITVGEGWETLKC